MKEIRNREAGDSALPGDGRAWASFEAEDIVQETIMHALESFHRFQPGTNCRAWLMKILQHVMSNRRRVKRRSRLISDPDDRIGLSTPFVPPIAQHLTDEDILGALRRLPESFQQVIVLCDVEELTYKEIAAVLALPIGTVMSRLHRGRTLLRAELATSTHVERERVNHVAPLEKPVQRSINHVASSHCIGRNPGHDGSVGCRGPSD